ncbi:hypothetical protein [Actinocorallia populi]|uniref:hypothetical protein n=1 Tax=Actinocorallia populi TaxID=2079200 RepID=UPI000D089534|nr:hypothetical protein [Actinocorallia populi]
MSYEERRIWAYAAVAAVVPAVYVVIMLGRLADAGAAEVSYVRPLLVAVAAGIVVNFLAGMLIGTPDRRDERDVGIFRYGTQAGYFVLAAGAAGALALTLAEAAHFWIANALYLAFILDALTSSAVKIVAYRRGF